MDDTSLAALDTPTATDNAGSSAPIGVRRRKRSLNLSLVLMGATVLGGLAGCGNLESPDNGSRDVYADMEACKADWGTPGDCEEIDSKRSATGRSSYYGPRYFSRSGSYGYNPTPRSGSRSIGSVSASPSRSGFGSSASRHSSGGSSSHASGGG